MEEAEEVDVPEYYVEEDEEEEEEGEEGCKELYEFQPLPTLLEDEENVSLADILSLRDNSLAEQDIWAICLECCYSMKDISHAAIFQTLCITPDTLAFNTSGNVCFMEQLSDDPEGAFVPPEFDLTGNTLEAHIYSLGATLKAAIEFVVDPDSEITFCQDLNSLLDSMQQENPADRPDIESIISLCEEKINDSSSSICRSLSSIGRRVLSIESVSAFQDGWESLWKGIHKDNYVKAPITEKCPSHILSMADNSSICHAIFTSANEEEHQNGWRETDFKIEKPCFSPNSFGHYLKKNKRAKSPSSEKFENFEREKVEDEMAKLYLKKHRRNKHSSVVNLVDKHSLSPSPPGVGMVSLKSWPSFPSCLSPNENSGDQDNSEDGQTSQPTNPTHFANLNLHTSHHTDCLSPLGQSKCHSQVSYENLVMALEQENQQYLCSERNKIIKKYATSEDSVSDSAVINTPPQYNKDHKTFTSAPVYHEDVLSASRNVNSPELDADISGGNESAALNEDQRWVSLKEFLTNYRKPLQEDELWALCHECLYTLQTYVDYPAILCLESVLIDQNGEVLIVTPQNGEPYDAFCVPPEYGPDGDEVGTEKTCVYGIAAIIWSAAKFNFPTNHKLALPKKLKRLFLQMAKRDADERPSLAEVLQICRKYLQQKNLDSRKIWEHLISFADQSMHNCLYHEETGPHDSESSTGFVPVTTNKKLMAVKGPVPLNSVHANLPAAFTSPATYFKPIVILQNSDINSNEITNPLPCTKPCVTTEDAGSIEVTDIENHADEETRSQSCKSHNGSFRTQVSIKPDSRLSDGSSDRKEKVPSAASSVSSDSSTLTSSPIVNNYLLKQDPKTGNLTLVRVQLSIPEHIPNLSLEAEPVSQSIKACTVLSPSTITQSDSVSNVCENGIPLPAPSLDKCRDLQCKPNAVLDGLPVSNGSLAVSPDITQTAQDNHSTNTLPETVVNGDSQTRRNACSPLQKVVNLLHDEFAFDGYLENGVEDIAMGEYIFALKGLQHTTFCSAICEKFCDLYWDDHLLENLYKIINGKFPQPIRKVGTDLSLHQSPAQLLKKIQRKSRKYRKEGKQSANEQTQINECEDSLATTELERTSTSCQPPSADDADPADNTNSPWEYIFALKGLQHTTFCSAICEKFCDLYWDDHLLENLYKIINGKFPQPIRKVGTDLSLHQSPAQLLKKIQRKSRKYRKEGKQSANEQTQINECEDSLATTELERTSTSCQPPSADDADPADNTNSPCSKTQVVADTDEIDVTDFPPLITEKDQQPQSPRLPTEPEEDFVFPECNSLCASPDSIEENEETSVESLMNQRENMSVCPSEVYKCGSGWSSAFYGAELFDPDVQHYVSILGRQKDKCSKSIEAKRLELEQQLMIETKNYRKTIKLYQNLMPKGKKHKGSEVKELLPKLKSHLEEMKSKVQFLELAKKLLQVSYAEQWGLESRDLPTVANLASLESLSSSEDDAFLLTYNEKGHTRHNTSTNLQAGTTLGLLAHLYMRNSVLDGYVQQLLYTFRYFCSQEDLLQFLIDRINNTLPREGTDPSCMDAKIYHRSLLLLQTWIEDCWHIDFSMNPDLLDKLEDLSNSQILPKDERGEYLVSLLQEVSSNKYTISSPGSGSDKKGDTKSLHSLCTKFSEDNVSRKSFNWKLSRGNGLHLPHPRDKQYTISAALPRPCYPGIVEDLSTYYIKGEETGACSVHDYSVQQIASQLTLLQEEMFQKCHPVHFLNSRALGVRDKSSSVPKTFYIETLPAEVCSLFSPSCTHDKYLLKLLQFADNVSTWVAAEIVTCHTSKLQASILTKFLLVAKLCYERRDFASAVQILGGLENLIVRQLLAWKNLPSKVSEILEELKAVEVFLKSDSLCLMKGDRFRTLPTIPSAYLLAMHVQQLETGGFTMVNGAFKWNKLRNIAKVVSQVHAFQEIPYSFTPDPDLQFFLRQRISNFSDADISVLAADNHANLHHVNSEKHSRKIQETLRRMKATFQ
ncbi:kinase non-catalytic C-lobe domain-containing protein 1 [Pseudophryne corroboree]|uniref:kinase non-catalytic C-lobe domain-containing protein 1 n=1 Tax=Pseudophryne corroboree TaxID=495146 RepID=UPI0030820AAB